MVNLRKRKSFQEKKKISERNEGFPLKKRKTLQRKIKIESESDEDFSSDYDSEEFVDSDYEIVEDYISGHSSPADERKMESKYCQQRSSDFYFKENTLTNSSLESDNVISEDEIVQDELFQFELFSSQQSPTVSKGEIEVIDLTKE